MTTLETLRLIDETLAEIEFSCEAKRTPCHMKHYRQEEADYCEASLNALSQELNEKEGF